MSEIPSKWMAIVVQYGERKKHFCADTYEDGNPNFFATESEAQKWAEDHCRYDQKAMVLILKAERIVRAKPVEFENVNAEAVG